LELRNRAKALGIDFEREFGERFEEVEENMTRTSSSSKKDKKGKGRVSDLKGKGKARMDDEMEEEDTGEGGKEVVDTRLTSAQVRAKEGGGKGGYRKGPLPNDEILRIKQKEWDKAKIVPLTFRGTVGGGGIGNAPKINKEAMNRAKQRAMDREAKRRREARKTGGIDGWIDGALAGPSKENQAMPGGLPRPKSGSDSDSSSDGDSSDGDSGPGEGGFNLAGILSMIQGGGRKRKSHLSTPAVMAANQEAATAARRILNANMRCESSS
jgi:hypothetical protein